MRVAGAVDIGGTGTKLAIIGEDGSIVARETIPTGEGGDPESLVERIGVALGAMLDAARASGSGTLVSSIGVAVAGFLDTDRSAMFGNSNLPALSDYPLRLALVARLRRDCWLEVDSNAALIAEHRHGVGRGSLRTLGVTVGTGLGGAVIVNNKLLRYTGECAGDLGHIIVDPQGRQCTCGARGCLEAMVCSAALRERGGGRAVREILAAARAGDAQALEALGETGHWLGIGLAGLVPVFAPELIVVGGGVAAAGELLLGPTRASFDEHAAVGLSENLTIVGSEYNGWEGVVGAGSLVLNPEH